MNATALSIPSLVKQELMIVVINQAIGRISVAVCCSFVFSNTKNACILSQA